MFAAGLRCLSCLVIASIILLCGVVSVVAQQRADPDFDATVDKPTFQEKQPKVLFDEAHHNFHTAAGRYKPFADLITNDGYRVTPNKGQFTKQSLEGYDVLVIANALGAEMMMDAKAAEPAFTDEECDTVRDWVDAGGRLLLITDHFPMGAAAENLGKRFGVQMSRASHTIDEKHYEKSGNPGWLIFSRENKLLGDHPIVQGRGQSEIIRHVTTFVGQSLKGPEGSVAFLKLADSAEDAYGYPPAGKKRVSAAGRAQGVALKAGKGRVVVLGEAAVLSAQVVKEPGKEPYRTGMTFPGSDNRQLALNIMHWLSGVLD
jgi:hypothetical protein